MKKYSKSLIAVLGIILTGINVLYGTNPEVQLVLAAAVAAGVYQVPNKK